MTPETAFREQAKSNEALGSPFTARVLRLVADRIAPGSPVIDRMPAFTGDLGPSGPCRSGSWAGCKLWH